MARRIPSGVNATLIPKGSQIVARTIHFQHRSRSRDESGDGGGKREGQIHEGIDQPLAEELVTRQNPCDEKTKHRVDCGTQRWTRQ